MDYFGLYLSSDMKTGHSKAHPRCSTFDSPRLSNVFEYIHDARLSCEETFTMQAIEVWRIGDRPAESTQPKPKKFAFVVCLIPHLSRSALDQDVEDLVIMKLAGHEQHSEGIREKPEDDE